MCVVALGPAPLSKQRNQHAGFVTGSCTTAASSPLSLSLSLSSRCKNSCTSAHGSCCQERNVIKRVRERVPPLERVHLGGAESSRGGKERASSGQCCAVRLLRTAKRL